MRAARLAETPKERFVGGVEKEERDFARRRGGQRVEPSADVAQKASHPHVDAQRDAGSCRPRRRRPAYRVSTVVGRLSTQKKPRSSSARSAVDLPCAGQARHHDEQAPDAVATGCSRSLSLRDGGRVGRTAGGDIDSGFVVALVGQQRPFDLLEKFLRAVVTGVPEQLVSRRDLQDGSHVTPWPNRNHQLADRVPRISW